MSMVDNYTKIDGHFENHPYVFIDKNDKAIATYLFLECNNEEFLNNILEELEAKEYISLCNNSKYETYHTISNGMKYENELFYAEPLYPSWQKDTEAPIWKAPIPKPTETHDDEGNEIDWGWDEEHKCWSRFIYIENPNENNGDNNE